MSKLQKIKPATFLLPQEGKMNVPGLVIATEELLAEGDIENHLNKCATWQLCPE